MSADARRGTRLRSTVQRTVEWARSWSYAHPRLRMLLREGWGASRLIADRFRISAPFEPSEFADLRRAAADARTPGRNPTVLILSFRGWSTHVVIETAIAGGLRQRGAVPVFATCGGRLPICDVVPAPTAPPMPCLSCANFVRGALSAAGFGHLEVRGLVDVGRELRAAEQRLVPLTTVAACEQFMHGSYPLGAWVRTSVSWFLSRGSIEESDPLALPTYRRFLSSSLVLCAAFERLLDSVKPDRVFLVNGNFFAERILAELAARRDIPTIRYERGFTPSSLLVSQWLPEMDDLDPGDAAWAAAARESLTEPEESEIDEYLRDRVAGNRTFDAFWNGGDDTTVRDIRAQLGLTTGRPIVSAFCNILWDSAIQGKDDAFPNMTEWVTSAILWAQRHTEVDLIVRVHPAEVKLLNHPTREPIAALVRRRFPELPTNVRVLDPASPLNSYALAAASTVGLVYTSTLGLEMACTGMPVVVAGRAHYARRGFTDDPADQEAYWTRTMERINSPFTDGEVLRRRELARRYAHLFFFRFHQTLRFLDEPGRSRVRLRVESAADLDPGRDPAFDRVVDSVLTLNGALVTPSDIYRSERPPGSAGVT